MLKRLSVENFSSIGKEQILDLTAGRTEVLPEHVYNFEKVGLLKSAAIYGANASGKSNLVKAIDFAKQIIVDGLEYVDTYNKHFRLAEDMVNKSTSFDFEIEIAGRFYSYGFSILLKFDQVCEEWLYEVGMNTPELVFERKQNEIELGKTLSKGEAKPRFEIYRDDMKNQHSQLFLSEVASKELEIESAAVINSVYEWFDNKLKVIYPDDTFGGIHAVSEQYATVCANYLKAFDTGVVDVETIEEDFEIGLKGVPDKIKRQIASDIHKIDEKEVGIKLGGEFYTILKAESGDLSLKKIGLVHGKLLTDTFDLEDESDGTKRLLDFIPMIGLFDEDVTFIIDEFDRSLHPKLTRSFFELFYKYAEFKSQLIVTTHESTLLDLDFLRRDEVWFVEKDDVGSSSLFSLNQFKERYDKKVEKAYLLGRYGAIPVFKPFDNIDL